jgi:dCTP deaminase
MILCDTEIVAAIRSGQVIIDPRPSVDNVTTTAVDLTLGGEFHRWKVPNHGGVTFSIDPSHPQFSYPTLAKDYLEALPLQEGGVILKPGEFVLGITTERVELPIGSRLAARVEGRSTLARLGLGVHVTAPTIHAGFRGRITLEITNQGQLPLRLCPGLRICQLIFEQVFGTPSADMTGIFQDQQAVTGRG